MSGADHGGSLHRNHMILAALLLSVLAYLIVLSISSGKAYVSQYRLNATIDQWMKNKTPQQLDVWLNLETFARDALRGNESNVDIINASGRLYDYRSARMAATRKQQLAFGHKAMDYYRQVTRLRPAWPYGWMNLASSKARLGEVDQEFRTALQQLIRLGRWEQNTLPSIIQLSLYAWPYLDISSRQTIIEYYLVAQKFRKKDVLKAIHDINKLKLYCAIVMHKGEKASFCP